MPSRDRATAWTGTPCSPNSRIIVGPTGSSAPNRIAGGSVALLLMQQAPTHFLGNGQHRRIDDIEALFPIPFTQSVRVVNVRAPGPAPETEQGQLARNGRRAT